MAPRSNTSLANLSLLLLLAIFLGSSEAYGHLQLKETNFIFYIQDFYSGPNATTAIVTGITGKLWSYVSFGTLSVTNDPITASPNKESPQIARFQSFQITTSSDGLHYIMMYSIMFTNQEYNGSTLQLQGHAFNDFTPSEMAVVGGTGKFRFATGFATLTLLSTDTNLFSSLTLCNITVVHY